MVTRVAVIDRDLCIKEKCGYVCAKVCPPNRMGDECIVVEPDTSFPAISEPLCIGCGLCVKKCPVSCIDIINIAKELDEPIYQYGINTFRLYGLPLPEKGASSIVGKNGIGKSSAIKLLTRQIKPNFAIFDKNLTDSEILLKLPLETRRYFQSGSNNRFSLKPQHVDKLKIAFTGTVRELLSAVAGSVSAQKISELFAIGKILDRKVAHLSGGELQKVAIATAYLKDADIYYFDEVTNYLDIEERLRAAVILKSLSETKSVLLAEHDLSILDYVSDYVYLVYGQENVYGVVSHLKNVRSGINEYIEGYLKDENVRFRDYPISFTRHSEDALKSKPLLSYSAFSKSFGEFTFSSDSGEIKKGEILGLVGKNALGKSLFVKLLSNLEKGDSGAAIELKLSYKPQYIEASKQTVSEMLSDSSINQAFLEECKRKLNLNSLMDKSLDTLSGGELQRVFLSKALATEAEVYLFDEPTAFLDIEQRFEFASLLRRRISESEKCAFVVDHDVVFIDAISNRLVVFEGESSVSGHATTPLLKKEGMNKFLKITGITMRRDHENFRPRINKPDSALDSEQKSSGNYFLYEK